VHAACSLATAVRDFLFTVILNEHCFCIWDSREIWNIDNVSLYFIVFSDYMVKVVRLKIGVFLIAFSGVMLL